MRDAACIQVHAHTQAHARTHTGRDGQAGVRGSDKFVLVMSEQYFEFCLKELRWAQQYNKEVRIEGTNDPKEGTNNPNKGTNSDNIVKISGPRSVVSV
jgi:hypothetical protein